MCGKRKQKSDIIITMSMFSFSSNDPVVVPVETTEEPTEAVEDQDIFVEYEGVSEEDYTTAEEPDFGDDL